MIFHKYLIVQQLRVLVLFYHSKNFVHSPTRNVTFPPSFWTLVRNFIYIPKPETKREKSLLLERETTLKMQVSARIRPPLRINGGTQPDRFSFEPVSCRKQQSRPKAASLYSILKNQYAQLSPLLATSTTALKLSGSLIAISESDFLSSSTPAFLSAPMKLLYERP